MATDEKQQLALRTDRLAALLGGLKRDDPRRAEIIDEILRLSLLSAAAKGQAWLNSSIDAALNVETTSASQ